jgi:hypothetical protein
MTIIPGRYGLADHWAGLIKIQCSSVNGIPYPVLNPNKVQREGGRITGSKVRILTAPGADVNQTGEWRQNVFYYDDKGRQIYSYSEDTYRKCAAIHKQYNGTAYDFMDRPLLIKHVSSNANSTDGYTDRTELYRNLYDPVTGQLTQTKRKGGASPWSISSMYAYDELGRVKRKVLGNYGEVQDMDYNIRGQLLGINGTYAETGDKEGESRTLASCSAMIMALPSRSTTVRSPVWPGGVPALPIMLRWPMVTLRPERAG